VKPASRHWPNGIVARVPRGETVGNEEYMYEGASGGGGGVTLGGWLWRCGPLPTAWRGGFSRTLCRECGNHVL